jgi:hypothetical protein
MGELSLFQAIQVNNLVWLANTCILLGLAAYSRRRTTHDVVLEFGVMIEMLMSSILSLLLWISAPTFKGDSCTSSTPFIWFWVQLSATKGVRWVNVTAISIVLFLYTAFSIMEVRTRIQKAKKGILPTTIPKQTPIPMPAPGIPACSQPTNTSINHGVLSPPVIHVSQASRPASRILESRPMTEMPDEMSELELQQLSRATTSTNNTIVENRLQPKVSHSSLAPPGSPGSGSPGRTSPYTLANSSQSIRSDVSAHTADTSFTRARRSNTVATATARRPTISVPPSSAPIYVRRGRRNIWRHGDKSGTNNAMFWSVSFFVTLTWTYFVSCNELLVRRYTGGSDDSNRWSFGQVPSTFVSYASFAYCLYI